MNLHPLRLGLAAVLCAVSMAPHAAEELLDPEIAFKFEARAVDDKSLEVRFRIAKGYFLYREKFRFALEGAQLGEPRFPPGKIKEDEFFGRVETYRGDLRIPIALVGARPGQKLDLSVTSQGCADLGVCFPPQQQKSALLVPLAAATVAPSSSAPSMPSVAANDLGERSPAVQSPASASAGARSAAAAAPAGAAGPSGYEDAGQAERLLAGGNLALSLLGFFGFGLLLAFTPCMLPMLPILSGLIVGHGKTVTAARGFMLALVYVLGMAVTYALAGVLAAASGMLLASVLQNPWVLGGFAIIFVLLALSMFGVYHLQLPASLQAALRHRVDRLPGGRYAAVLVMGVLSGLIIGPCVAAPLAGALLYIARTGDQLLGGTALFAMGLGMGLPLLFVGASAGSVLPRAGVWMESVQRAFGWLLLFVAAWLLAPVLPLAVQMAVWGSLLCALAVYLRVLDGLPHDAPGITRLGKALGVVLLLAGVAQWVGAMSGGTDVLQPLSGLRASTTAPASGAPQFQRVRDSAQLDGFLEQAKGRPVMLDFYADWCVSCKEMERFTFADAKVGAKLAEFALVQADVTLNDSASKELLKRFGLFGPPGIIFFDAAGRELPNPRVIGFLPAERFLAVLHELPR
ncbi:MAG: protein-disulfide reductase DsbD [Betaproteobacteria bacterium]|nr:protein-disulfide reductase DsbD [Betaproteobacteria bacterium]